MSRVELYAAIRRDSRVDGLSSRELAGKYRVGRRVVALALSSAWPEPRKKLPPRASRLDPWKAEIDRILRADLDAPRKQRHTTRRVFERLVAEHGADGISYSMVRAYVAARKPEIWVEAGRGPPQVFIPQVHQPGQDAEVDFGDIYVDLAGIRTLCYMFVFRLSFSGKAVHRISASEGQEAFLEGHAHAFSVLGGVPAGKVRYDNLTSAVARVLGFTRARVETDRWTAFRSWAGLDAFYCQPGLQGAHRADTDDPGHAQFFHGADIGAMVQLGGHEAMPPAVPRQKDHFPSGERAGEKIIRGRAEGRFHLHPFLPGEPFHVIKAAAANNANAIFFHKSCGRQIKWNRGLRKCKMQNAECKMEGMGRVLG